MDFDLVKARSLLYRNVRNFFDEKGYLEVETPILSPTLIPEPTIEDFATEFTNEFRASRQLYMVPSPEIFMKRILAEGSPSIYQISKCFRNAEQIGHLHNPEFTMLEYYTVGYDEKDSIALTEEMFCKTAIPGCPDGLKGGFEVVSMADALKKATGLDLEAIQDYATLRKQAVNLGLAIDPSVREGWDDTFNRIFVAFVEPALTGSRPVCLTGYPAQIECLAENDGMTKKRWELYWDGVEIANCYAEETDPLKVRDCFRKEYAALSAARSVSGSVIPDVDDKYWEIFRTFPKCSGVAIGMDRLLMTECKKKSIGDLILFPVSDIL
ncbi:MAG: elongation factor P--(R)-beta-lysine ligase [Sphaerochaetaceae bacterium]|nr:elongation factor P--(R)-beta-lysine ligase [Sphaerochaetaceae bacterium]MDD4006500.1 elongation factor P--(R)-beta-lysine ligase [Sphaerochaetaceae bacterium]MDD4395962.1 elongation factor P--(R)-beta-lysine ligase [Sphaerochaetaceae bacterium]